MEHIDSYSFGSITVNGMNYTSDVIVYPDEVSPNWWRSEGHMLSIDDLKEVLDYHPEVIVIGKGASGAMQVPDEVIDQLEEEKIEVVCENTDKACQTFNRMLNQGKRAVGAFHLTC